MRKVGSLDPPPGFPNEVILASSLINCSNKKVLCCCSCGCRCWGRCHCRWLKWWVGDRSGARDFFGSSWRMLWLPGAFWEVPGVPLGLLGCSLGVHLGSLGCLKGTLEGPLGHSGGLMRIPGLLLVALGGLLSILGRSWGTFQAIPGDSGSHFGSILA